MADAKQIFSPALFLPAFLSFLGICNMRMFCDLILYAQITLCNRWSFFPPFYLYELFPLFFCLICIIHHEDIIILLGFYTLSFTVGKNSITR